MTYYVSRGGHEYGPYSLIQLQQYVSEGRIAPSDLVRTEGVQQWATVSEVIAGAGATGAAPAARATGEAPPALHWGLVLLIDLITCGVFGWVWMFVQAAYMKKQRPQNGNYIILYAVGLATVIGASFASGVASGLGSETKSIFYLIEFGGAIVILVGHFQLRNAIEEVFGIQLSGAMTFFFNTIYFQYHLNRVRQQRLTGVWS